MAGVNKVILVGNLGKDPEVRYLDNNKVVANLTLATTENYKDRNGNKVENTEWHDLELWDGLAKIAEQYLRKGSKIYIEGQLQTRKWQDQNGVDKYTTEVVLQGYGGNLTMLDSRASGGDSFASSPSQPTPLSENPDPVSSSGMDDEIPF